MKPRALVEELASEEDEYFSLRLMQQMSEHRNPDINKRRKSGYLELYIEA